MIGKGLFRFRRALFVVCLIAVSGWGLFFAPTGFLAVFPGSALELDRIVTVEGGEKASQGDLLMTTVSSRDASPALYLLALIDPRVDLRRKKDILPPGKDMREYWEDNRRMMENSQNIAKVLALQYLGIQAELRGRGVLVRGVLPKSPAADKLKEHDVIVSINGTRLGFVEDLMEVMASRSVGDKLEIGIVRNGHAETIEITAGEHPEIPGRAGIGVYIETYGFEASIPREITIAAGSVTGPSAGLMFALEIINQMIPEDLTYGQRIAGTGVLLPDGRVGAVGGVKQKVKAAEAARASVFLVPRANAQDAVSDGLKIIVVDSLEDALAKLRALQ